MFRRSLFVIVPAMFLVGCMKPAMPMGPPKKPDVPVEMKKLDRLIGNWTGTAEMVEPNPEDMKAMMPESERSKFQNKFAFGGKNEWVFGGMALKGEGWYEMGEGMRVTYVEYWTWNPKKNQFETLFMSDWGEKGTGSATMCPDCDGFCSKGEGLDAQGMKKKFSGCMVFRDDRTMDWKFTEHNPYGKMVMKGTSTRQ